MHYTFLSILLVLTAQLAQAVPTTIPNTTVAGFVLREDIPPGVEISGLDSIEERAETTDSSPNPAGILKRSDCNGSSSCSGLAATYCQYAYSRFSDNTAYCGYTSRVSVLGQCTAIFTCTNHNNYCLYGWYIKQQFAKIYSEVGCGKCGTYSIPNGGSIGCRATLNYCFTCNDVG